MLRDFGVESGGIVYADSSAATAIANRKGAGKLRHININCLWIQEQQDTKQLELRKALGTDNPADMMTTHIARQSLGKCMRHLNQFHVTGRAKARLDVQGSKRSEDMPGGALGGSPGGCVGAPGDKLVAAPEPKQPRTPCPRRGNDSTRLGSLTVCAVGSSVTLGSGREVLRRSNLDRPIPFQ